MILNVAAQAAVVDALWLADKSGGRAPAPTQLVKGFDVDAGYTVQRALINRHLVSGRSAIGWKVGMTSAVGRTAATPGPIYGRLLSHMVVSNGGQISHAGLHEPFVEGEIAFILGEELHGPGVGIEDVLAATLGVCPAIEVFATRLVPNAQDIPDLVADNASSARVVLGDRTTNLADIDLRLAGVLIRHEEEILATGAGAQVLGHPARAVAWLANTLSRVGEGLASGDIILTGALAGAHAAHAGKKYVAEFDRLGEVSVDFS